MKKVLFLFFSFLLSVYVMAQKSSVSFAGGAFVAMNQTTAFIGFMGPKVSITVTIKNFTTEVGLTGVPGLMLKPEEKLGLAVGPTLTFKRKSWGIKPVIGCIFVKTTKWQPPMIGIGFQF